MISICFRDFSPTPGKCHALSARPFPSDTPGVCPYRCPVASWCVLYTDRRFVGREFSFLVFSRAHVQLLTFLTMRSINFFFACSANPIAGSQLETNNLQLQSSIPALISYKHLSAWKSGFCHVCINLALFCLVLFFLVW